MLRKGNPRALTFRVNTNFSPNRKPSLNNVPFSAGLPPSGSKMLSSSNMKQIHGDCINNQAETQMIQIGGSCYAQHKTFITEKFLQVLRKSVRDQNCPLSVREPQHRSNNGRDTRGNLTSAQTRQIQQGVAADQGRNEIKKAPKHYKARPANLKSMASKMRELNQNITIVQGQSGAKTCIQP